MMISNGFLSDKMVGGLTFQELLRCVLPVEVIVLNGPLEVVDHSMHGRSDVLVCVPGVVL